MFGAGGLALYAGVFERHWLEIAYKAYVSSLDGRQAPVIDGWTGAQRFFLGYAQSYMGKRRDALLVAERSTPPENSRDVPTAQETA